MILNPPPTPFLKHVVLEMPPLFILPSNAAARSLFCTIFTAIFVHVSVYAAYTTLFFYFLPDPVDTSELNTGNQECPNDSQACEGVVSAADDQEDETLTVGTRTLEKLHEDDRRQQPRWKTILYKILPFLENGMCAWNSGCNGVLILLCHNVVVDVNFYSLPVEDLRRVIANNPLENSKYKYVVSILLSLICGLLAPIW